jgi:hypothetical protein
MSYYRIIDGKKYDRALLEAFERSIDGQGDGRVSGTDVEKEISERAADGKGLTQVEIDTLRWAADHYKVTTRGQEELGALVGKLHGQPIFQWQNVDNPLQAQLDTQAMDRAKLNEAAAAFVIANASSGASVEDGKLFPGVDSSNMGMFAYTLDGAQGDLLHKMAKAMMNDSSQALLDGYDPSKHLLLGVRVTFDEERMYVGLVDKATGKVEVAGDYIDYTMLDYAFNDADDFEAKTGLKVSDVDASVDPDYWNEMDQEELAHSLTRGGRLLDLGKSDDVFGRPTRPELASLSYTTDSDWGDENIMSGTVEAEAGQLPFGFDLGRAAVQVMNEELRWDGMEWSSAPASDTPRAVTDAVIKQAAKAVHDGFGYAPQNTDSLSENLSRIEKMIDKLGKRADIQVVVAEGQGKADHMGPDDEDVAASTHLFVNTKTGDFVAVTARSAGI